MVNQGELKLDEKLFGIRDIAKLINYPGPPNDIHNRLMRCEICPHNRIINKFTRNSVHAWTEEQVNQFIDLINKNLVHTRNYGNLKDYLPESLKKTVSLTYTDVSSAQDSLRTNIRPISIKLPDSNPKLYCMDEMSMATNRTKSTIKGWIMEFNLKPVDVTKDLAPLFDESVLNKMIQLSSTRKRVLNRKRRVKDTPAPEIRKPSFFGRLVAFLKGKPI